ncbi:MAG: mandelate racemase, partial [Acidobacteria bacterium]|nr:mandelate racemase [Acidobacteriota bacterium]
MPDRFTISPFDFFVLRTRTRFPFRYGIASMTDVPHLFLRARVTVAAESTWGLGTEGLPPKWFTKNPATTFEQDLP